jgi:hypothetical protein
VAGVSEIVCCHAFRATGSTVYLQNGATLEEAPQTGALEPAGTTKLYEEKNAHSREDSLNGMPTTGDRNPPANSCI